TPRVVMALSAAVPSRESSAEHAPAIDPNTTATMAVIRRFDISAFPAVSFVRGAWARPTALARLPKAASEPVDDYARIVTSGERRPAARASVAAYASAASF